MRQQNYEKRFAGRIIKDIIDVILKDARKTYGQATDAYVLNWVTITDTTTTNTVSLRSKIASKMRELTKGMDEKYSSYDENDDSCGYRTTYEDEDT